MTDEQAQVNLKLDGEILQRVEMVMQAWAWNRHEAVRQIIRKGLDLPTPMDRMPDAKLDGEGN